MTVFLGSPWRLWPTVVLACLLIGPPPAVGATGATITWRVENPFRLFLDPAATNGHRAAFGALPPDEQRTPVLAMERRLASLNPRGWAEAIVDHLCWSAGKQRYGCAGAEAYAHPTRHRVRIGLDRPGPGTCRWTIADRTPGVPAPRTAVTRPCVETFVAEVAYPGGAVVTLVTDDGMRAEADVRVRDLLIVGIGDSFASGDGNPDVPVRLDDRRTMLYRGPGPSTPVAYPARAGAWTSPQDPAFANNGARWMSTACHRSLYGHHARAALLLALEDPHRAVTFASFACWGSDLVNGVFLPMKPTELVPHLPRLSQLSAVAELQCRPGRVTRKDWPRAYEMGGALPELIELTGLYCPPDQARRIDLLLVAIGGNDVGFAQLVANAVLSDGSVLRQVSGWLGQLISPARARTALVALPLRYKALNRAAHSMLHIPWSEADRIILTSYPPIAQDDDTDDVCVGGRDGMTVNPSFALDQRRTRDAEQIGRELHDVMRRSARAHGWTFVDGHRERFKRHGLCAGRADRLANPADDVRLPQQLDGVWHPYPPSQWEPYAPRRRWVRTPNDGYLTVNFHVSRINDAMINLMLASSYSGAFHPTAEGHAAMADALVERGRAVLNKYASK